MLNSKKNKYVRNKFVSMIDTTEREIIGYPSASFLLTSI